MDLRAEKAIIIILWIGVVISFTTALAMGYSLMPSNYIGLSLLSITTISFFGYKKATFPLLFITLFVGMINIAHFLYFINLIIGLQVYWYEFQPGLQLYSFLLISFLLAVRREEVIENITLFFGKSAEKLTEDFDRNRSFFKTKFEKLGDHQINKRLTQGGLDPAAEAALLEIKKERKIS